MISLHESAKAVLRLVNEGMSLKHAVSLVSGTYGYSVDELYKQIARIESNH
jgi:hypothetical protein